MDILKYTPQQCGMVLFLPVCIPRFIISCILVDSHFNWSEMKYPCSFDLHFYNDYRCWPFVPCHQYWRMNQESSYWATSLVLFECLLFGDYVFKSLSHPGCPPPCNPRLSLPDYGSHHAWPCTFSFEKHLFYSVCLPICWLDSLVFFYVRIFQLFL